MAAGKPLPEWPVFRERVLEHDDGRAILIVSTSIRGVPMRIGWKFDLYRADTAIEGKAVYLFRHRQRILDAIEMKSRER